MVRSFLVALLLAAVLLTAAPSIAAPPPAPPAPALLDQEVWAGISYRDAIFGVAAMATGGAAISWITGSTVLAVSTVVAVGLSYVVYDPGVTGVVAPSDVPDLRELRRRNRKD